MGRRRQEACGSGGKANPDEKARRIRAAEFLSEMQYRRGRERANLRAAFWLCPVLVWLAFGAYVSWQVARIMLVPLRAQILGEGPGFPSLLHLCLGAFFLYALLSAGLWAFVYSRFSQWQ